MGLITRSIVVNEQDWKRLPEHERSSLLRKMVKQYLMNLDEKAEDIDIEILNMEIQHLKTEMIKVSTQLEDRETKRKHIVDRLEEHQKETLQKQKDQIEQAKKCLSCGKPIEEDHKKHKFNTGNVCNGCFLAADNKQIGMWMKGE